MWAWLISLFVNPFMQKLFQWMEQAASSFMLYVRTRQLEAEMKKKVEEKVKEIMNEKDPSVRARRMADLLNGL
jgi:uncharacterized protein with ATP-grasp and redox domains